MKKTRQLLLNKMFSRFDSNKESFWQKTDKIKMRACY